MGCSLRDTREHCGKRSSLTPPRGLAVKGSKVFCLFALTFVGCLRDKKKAPPSQSGEKKRVGQWGSNVTHVTNVMTLFHFPMTAVKAAVTHVPTRPPILPALPPHHPAIKFYRKLLSCCCYNRSEFNLSCPNSAVPQ